LSLSFLRSFFEILLFDKNKKSFSNFLFFTMMKRKKNIDSVYLMHLPHRSYTCSNIFSFFKQYIDIFLDDLLLKNNLLCRIKQEQNNWYFKIFRIKSKVFHIDFDLFIFDFIVQNILDCVI
jgi:hypothetical protein